MTDTRSFREIQADIKPKVILAFKRLYVLAFNVYSWYWLYREIFIRHSPLGENYLLWFFTTFGMYVFVLEHQEIFFRSGRKALKHNANEWGNKT